MIHHITTVNSLVAALATTVGLACSDHFLVECPAEQRHCSVLFGCLVCAARNFRGT